MNKLQIFLAALALLFMASCVDYGDTTGPVSQKVQVSLPASVTGTVDLSGKTVTLKSSNGASYTALTDASGVATFPSLPPDVYNIATSWDITTAEYTALTGLTDAPFGASFTATANSQVIDGKRDVTLTTSLSPKQNLVISKIYTAGSKDNNAKSYSAGQYIELYNQSNNDIDVAGLYIGIVETDSKPAYTLDEIKSDLGDSVVLVKQIFRIPTDKVQKIAPGATILLTNSAIDHSVNSPQEHSLLTADYEAKDRSKNPVKNNSNVTALDLLFSTFAGVSKMNLLQTAQSLIIFRSTADFSSPKLTYVYGKTKGNQYALVPASAVIDGVDFIRKKANGGPDASTKRLLTKIDAGYTTLESTGSGYTGEVLYRKTAGKAADGHKLLMDTNNSSNDFKVSTTIAPREYDD